jgi:prepilin-type N-terminal cleavage/methylation domain-containing protein
MRGGDWPLRGRGEVQNRAAGFTLVEVLVSLAVFAVCLTLALNTLSTGFFHQQRAKTLLEATLQAQSLLARIGEDVPLTPGLQEGELPNNLRWTVEVAPYGDGGDRQAWPVAAYSVTVRVFQGKTPPVIELTTLKLGPKT